METNLMNNNPRSPNKRLCHSESGFSLLEMIVAIFLLTIGLLGVASAISYALLASNRGRGVTNSKMLIVSILEQMETLRDTGQLHFKEISNSASADGTFGGFPAGFQRVSTVPGPDGIFGTADDLMVPGPGGLVEDLSLARPGVMRQILISTVPGNDYLKKITVTLQYSPNGGELKELVCSGYLNDNEQDNFIP